MGVIQDRIEALERRVESMGEDSESFRKKTEDRVGFLEKHFEA
jgi:hypothetical protein